MDNYNLTTNQFLWIFDLNLYDAPSGGWVRYLRCNYDVIFDKTKNWNTPSWLDSRQK